MKVFYNEQPGPIQYMPIPNGKADVWLRKNIAQETIRKETEGESTVWTADEVYFRTSLTREEVEADFEALYKNGGKNITQELPEPTVDERLDAIEAAILELAEVVTYG